MGLNKKELDPAIKRKVDMAIAEFSKKTNRDSIAITIGNKKTKDDNPADRYKSKLGGIPYWPEDMPWPTVSGRTSKHRGEPMKLFVQINFSELPHLDGYPSSGIFQFFAYDDSYLFDKYLCKTVYHPNPSKTINQLEDIPVSLFDVPDDNYNFPFRGVYFFEKYTLEKMPLQPTCEEFNSVFDPILKKYLGDYVRRKDNDIDDYIYTSINKWGHRIGGWPNFTQSDVMTPSYNRLLLQIDTEYFKDIIWGDDGVGNFFINDRDLAKKDFSDVLCNWDCY